MSSDTKLWAGIAVVAVAIAATIAWLRRPAPAVHEATPVTAAPADAGPEDAKLPAPAESDRTARSLLASASHDPGWATWLGQGDLLNRATVVTDNLAEGVSPRAQLGFLAPEGPFRANARGEVDPASYARHDGFARVIASLDEHALAQAERTLAPLLDASLHALGYPNRRFDETLRKALQRIAAAPVPDQPVKVTSKGARYLYADPRLEALPAVEKHLLRLGPQNEKLVQDKARALLAALQ